MRKGEEEIAHLAGEGGGSVAFGVGPLAALLVAPEAVIRFREQFPAASVRIVEGYTGALVRMVRDGALDFTMAMKAQAKPDPALAFRPLFRDDFIIVGRKNHPLRNAGSIAGLGKAVWAVSEPFASLLSRVISASNFPAPRAMVQCDSHNVLVSVIAKSDALGFITRRYLTTAPTCDLLQEIKIAESMPAITIALVMRKDPPLTPVAAAMAKIVTAVARQFTVKT